MHAHTRMWVDWLNWSLIVPNDIATVHNAHQRSSFSWQTICSLLLQYTFFRRLRFDEAGDLFYHSFVVVIAYGLCVVEFSLNKVSTNWNSPLPISSCHLPIYSHNVSHADSIHFFVNLVADFDMDINASEEFDCTEITSESLSFWIQWVWIPMDGIFGVRMIWLASADSFPVGLPLFNLQINFMHPFNMRNDWTDFVGIKRILLMLRLWYRIVIRNATGGSIILWLRSKIKQWEMRWWSDVSWSTYHRTLVSSALPIDDSWPSVYRS